MKILILGGTSFIGPYVARHLVAQGHTVAVFHRGKTHAALPDSIAHIYGERQNMRDFTPQFETFQADVVLDMFAYREQDAHDVVEVFDSRVERVVCISSMDVYRAYGCFTGIETGEPAPLPFDEAAPLRSVLYPYRAMAKDENDFTYQYDKIPIEQIVMSQKGFAGTILRLPQVYGPHDGQHRLAGYLKSMEAGSEILLPESKANWRWTRSYVEDVALAIALALTNEKAAGRIYNVGTKDADTELEWIRKVGEVVAWKGEVKAIPDSEFASEPNEPYDWRHDLVADTTRIREELGFAEAYSVEEGIQRTVAWERSESSITDK